MSIAKARVLIFGTGGVGAMAAYALEVGGKAEVTAIFRSNYQAVSQRGLNIDSIEHGHDIKGFRPTHIRNTVPNVVTEGLAPYDYIVVTAKNIPDVSPTVDELIAPAVTPGKTGIVLSQNGLNIEKPFIARFPSNPIISSVSMIGATEKGHGNIVHDDADSQKIGPFHNPNIPQDVAEAAARQYVEIYNGCGKLEIVYEPDTPRTRWRKLVYNASFNSTAAVLRIDTARMRMSEHIIDNLIRPIMLEIMAAAKAQGIELPSELPDILIRCDPTDTAFKPSMCQDVEKGNFIEFENIVGEPLREGEAKGVPMPTLKTMYGILKGVQLKTKEARGLWKPVFEEGNPYQ
ncbi:hypothetical protein P175DRAFT_0504333 [Aspergillus ochraceoroseus IBT 24754]|uniref:2-dehydropantoate 2-reductase n=3 Tax=Aspergillus subgen. Nidulantes TaxID=2720870 RepID=A0A2T5LQ50_9EURO|nr:uncharacterized protein P175DRAFT_0504333 [Aspergillus ochraceoroseus IBT 24754]KKK21502.1 hypothetical protein AOCH_001281 [Aspergillus ochraceoroseus]PTU18408.1 hypothetical protein P175DRAFT_0504333 [Aspergillus ochraceoroseus IBT 24754]